VSSKVLPVPQKVHRLKTWPEPFEGVRSGRKPYEIRKNDRDYAVGDVLVLEEWLPATGAYTGRRQVRRVTYMTAGGQWGLPADLCVLGMVALDDEAAVLPSSSSTMRVAPEAR
jgi:hypothetical protein